MLELQKVMKKLVAGTRSEEFIIAKAKGRKNFGNVLDMKVYLLTKALSSKGLI